jgi:hypothetical protein
VSVPGTDAEVDSALNRAARALGAVAPPKLDHISRHLTDSLSPVTRQEPPWVLAFVLLMASAAVAFAEAAVAGLDGLSALGAWRGAFVMTALMLLAGSAAVQSVSYWTPGSRVRLNATTALWGCCAALALLFGALLNEQQTANFVGAGLACLEQGSIHAIPVGVLSVVLLRRGYATNPTLAALMAGTFAGIAGVAYLEMHCANPGLFHQLLWHTGVVPLCAATVALIRWVMGRDARGGAVTPADRP